MRKFTKFCLIGAAVFAAVGIGFCAAGMASGASFKMLGQAVNNGVFSFGSGHVSEWSDETSHHNRKRAGKVESFNGGDIKEIELYLKYGTASVISTDAVREFQIDAGEWADYVKYDLDGNTLKIKSGSPKLKNGQIFIYVPENVTLREAEFEADAGVITAENLSVKKLEVNIGAGQFESLGTLEAKEVNLKVGVGEMNVESLSASAIELECGMGAMSITLTGEEADYSYEVECGLGEVNIGTESYSALAKDAKVCNDRSTRKLEASCGMGEIDVNFGE